MFSMKHAALPHRLCYCSDSLQYVSVRWDCASPGERTCLVPFYIVLITALLLHFAAAPEENRLSNQPVVLVEIGLSCRRTPTD